MLPLSERRAIGRRLRAKVGRIAHAKWAPKKGRGDPVATIVAANADRVRELVPLKMGRMAAGPFAFFRGAAPVMAADLATLPMTGLRVQICGDAHVRNLGAYAAPEGYLVFDINDFDETVPGPWEWDLKRLATSLVLAGRQAGERKSTCRNAVEEMTRSYRTSMARFATMGLRDLAKVEIRRGGGTYAGPCRFAQGTSGDSASDTKESDRRGQARQPPFPRSSSGIATR